MLKETGKAKILLNPGKENNIFCRIFLKLFSNNVRMCIVIILQKQLISDWTDFEIQ